MISIQRGPAESGFARRGGVPNPPLPPIWHSAAAFLLLRCQYVRPETAVRCSPGGEGVFITTVRWVVLYTVARFRSNLVSCAAAW